MQMFVSLSRSLKYFILTRLRLCYVDMKDGDLPYNFTKIQNTAKKHLLKPFAGNTK